MPISLKQTQISLLIFSFTACINNQAPLAPPCSEPGEERSYLLSTLHFSPQENGVVNGFNLDGEIGNTLYPKCNQEDLVDPSGNQGIDNSLSSLLIEFSETEARDSTFYLQKSIEDGELLVLLRLTGINDYENDSCVNAELLLAQGPGLVDLDGEYLDGQTLARYPETKAHWATSASIEDAVLYAENLSIDMHFVAMEQRFSIPVHQASIKANIHSQDITSGYFGGSGPVDSFRLFSDWDQTDYTDFLRERIYANADMAPNELGICQNISLAFDFQTTPVYLFMESED